MLYLSVTSRILFVNLYINRAFVFLLNAFLSSFDKCILIKSILLFNTCNIRCFTTRINRIACCLFINT